MSATLSPIDLGYLDAAQAGLLAERLGQPLEPWQQRMIDAEMIGRRLREHRAQQDAGMTRAALLVWVIWAALEVLAFVWLGFWLMFFIHLAALVCVVVMFVCSAPDVEREWAERKRS